MGRTELAVAPFVIQLIYKPILVLAIRPFIDPGCETRPSEPPVFARSRGVLTESARTSTTSQAAA